jgi:hypothetical protein
MEIEWTETALADMADLDKGIARRVKQSIERFAETGAGNVKRLQDVTPPEFRLPRRRLPRPLSSGQRHHAHPSRPQPPRSLPLITFNDR